MTTASSVIAIVAALGGGWWAVAGGDVSTRPATQPGASFAGKWDTAWGLVELAVEGNKVTGKYDKDGKVEGKLSPDGQTLEGTWSQGPDYKAPNTAGRVILMLTDDGKWQGLWWKGHDGKGGTWVGTRAK